MRWTNGLDEKPEPRKGDWFQSLNGKKIYPLDPRVEDVDLDEVAHGLSNICRFGGQIRRFYSVAQHSVYVSRCVAETVPGFALAALLHDAPEAYLGDVIRPLKRGGAVTQAWLDAEDSWAVVIGEALGLDIGNLPPEVKVADDRVLMAERRDLLAQPPEAWRERGYLAWDQKIDRSWEPAEAKRRFLLEYRALRAGRRADDVEREEREALDARRRADGEALRLLLEPHLGRWVALDWHWREVFHAAPDDKELMDWIRANRPRGDQPTMVYRVPAATEEAGASGMKPIMEPFFRWEATNGAAPANPEIRAEVSADGKNFFEGGIPAVPLPDRRSEADRVRERWEETRGVVRSKVEILTKILGLCPDCKDVKKNLETRNVERLCARCRLALGGIV